MKLPYYGKRLAVVSSGVSCFEDFKEIGLGKGEVEIEVLETILNTGTERAFFLSMENTPGNFPFYPSGSGLGRIRRVGWGVKGLKKGDFVCGSMAHATNSILNADRLVKVNNVDRPKNLAALHLAVIAIQGIRMGNIQAKKKVAIMGQGVIGRLATLICRAIGAKVTVVTFSEKKLEYFKEKSGLAVSKPEDLLKFHSLKPEIIIDATGNPLAVNEAIKAIRNEGRIVLLGSNRGNTPSINFDHEKKSYSLVGAHIRNIESPTSNGYDYKSEIRFLYGLIRAGKLDLSDTITKEVQSSNLSSFYNDELKSTPHSGILVNWDDKHKLSKLIPKTPIWVREEYLPFDTEISIAIVGCGSSGHMHANSIIEGRSFLISFAVDTNLHLAKKFASKYSCEYSDNLDNALASKTCDVVLITTPHNTHKALALKAIRAGKHVIVDKPLANTLKDGRKIIEAAIKQKVFLRTFHQRIYEPSQQFARMLCEAGIIGKVLGVSVEFQRDRTQSYWYDEVHGRKIKSWRAKKETSGGGVLIMNLIHELDFLHYIANIRFKEVQAIMDTLYHPVEVEDSLGVIFSTEGGAVGTISASNTVRGHGHVGLRIWGTVGHLIIKGNEIRFFSNKQIGKYSSCTWHKVLFKEKIESRILFFRKYRKQLEENKETSFNDAGYKILVITSAIYASAQTGTKQKVNYE